MSLQTVLSAITRRLTRQDKAIDEIKRLTTNGPFLAGRASLQTIAAGVISVTRPHVVVLPESGTADNMDEIENFSDGKFIVISTADVGDTITVRDESVSGGNIALRGVTSRVLSDPEDSLLLIYKESVGFWIQAGGTPSGGTPALHASTHQHGGTDEVATATPAANAIPKAGGAGTLAAGWIPAGGTPGAHAASHQNGGSDELLHQTLDGAGTNTHGNIDSHIANTSNPHSVTKAQVGLGNVTDDAQIPLTQKGAANGVAELDASSRLPVAQLPVSVMEYKGTWDASTNTPTLADGTGSAGDVYRVSVAGTQNLGSGAITFGVGDYIIYNGSIWEKSDTTDSVVSVNGATGVVVLTTDNIAEGVAADRNYITDAEQTKLAGIEALADVTDMANVGAAIVAASDGGAPQDTDEFAVNRAGTLTTLLWTGLKTALTTLFNGLYVALTGNQDVAGIKTFTDDIVRKDTGLASIQIISDGLQAFQQIISYRASATGGFMGGYGARGTEASPAISQQNDRVFSFSAFGWSAAANAFVACAQINFIIDGSPDTAGDTTDMPGRITIQTTPEGSSAPAIAATFDSAQLVTFAKFLVWAGQKRVSTQFDKTNTTLATVTGLSVTVEAGKTYYFESVLFVDAAAAGGYKAGIGGTATATAILYHLQSFNSISSIDLTSRQTTLGGSAGITNDTQYMVIMRGTITVNAAGTLLVHFAQNAASGTSSVLVGSTFVVNQIA